MARLLRLSPRFQPDLRRAGVTPGTVISKAIMRTVSSLASGDLPTAADYEMMVPPVGRRWVRRVEGLNYWLTYRFDAETVTVVGLLTSPPVPLFTFND